MAKYSGYDAKLAWQGVVVGQVRDVGGPALQQEAIDVTTRDDLDQDQYVGGLRDGGDLSFDVIYDPALASQTALRTALENGTRGMGELYTTAIGTAQPGGLRFFGKVTGFQPNAPMRDALTADVSIKLSHRPAQIDYLVDHAGNPIVTAAGKYVIA